MILCDTHTHLFVNQFDKDRAEAIKRAMNLGVKYFFLPNIDCKSIEPMLKLATQYPENCFPMLGLHPTSVKENYRSELKKLKCRLDDGLFYAIGEVGIDLYWDKTHLSEQIAAFEQQIAWAKDYDLPLVIHARDSFDEIFEVLDRLHDEHLRGILHAFSGTLKQARKIIDYGFLLGIGGVVTYKNSGLDKVVQQLDLKHIVLETDSPWLTPVPKRGQRNESAYVYHIAQKIANLHQISITQVAEITTQNALNLFDVGN